MGVGAFVALKDEEEAVELQGKVLPSKKRMKVSTFRIAERYQGQRIGEGAMGLLLWKWQKSGAEEVYVTAFEKHKILLSLLDRFGFQKRGRNLNGEEVYIKSRTELDFSNPYKAFPFIKGEFDYAGYIIIDDNYHDTMFAYSELANMTNLQNRIGKSVSNGLSKIYVGQASRPSHRIGEPVLVYRRYTQGKGRRFHSCVTSFCIVTDVIQAKINGCCQMTFDELKIRIGNKSVFDEHELIRKYKEFKNVTIVEMLYYGYFGAGNNVNMDWLDNNGYWAEKNQYPTEVRLSVEQFKNILTEGKVDVPNVIIN